MTKIILAIILAFIILLSGCSDETQVDSSQLDKDRELLEQAAKEFLEEESVDSQKPQTTPNSPLQIDTDNSDEVFSDLDSSEESQEAQSEESSTPTPKASRVDIEILGVSTDFSKTFDLVDDEVEFDIKIQTSGLDDGEAFIVKIETFRKSGEEGSCQAVYIVGEGDVSCEIDDFPSLTTYEFEAYADIKEKYNESNLDNNFYRGEFELED